MPAVSLVLPARDAERTLPMAIESCLSQTLPDFELILVDHGSEDGTFSLMKQAARRDSRISVLRKPRDASFVAISVPSVGSRQGEGGSRVGLPSSPFPLGRYVANPYDDTCWIVTPLIIRGQVSIAHHSSRWDYLCRSETILTNTRPLQHQATYIVTRLSQKSDKVE